MASTVFLQPGFAATDGNGNVTMSGVLLLADGAPTAPSLASASQPTMGWYKAAGGVMDFMSPTYSASAPMFRLAGGQGPTIGSGIGIAWVSTGGANGTPTGMMTNKGAGQFNISTTINETTGVGIDTATDGVLKVRVRAQNAYGTLDTLGIKSSGTSGASFGPSAVASLTTVTGIVTAAS